jgi:hypothetical protein
VWCQLRGARHKGVAQPPNGYYVFVWIIYVWLKSTDSDCMSHCHVITRCTNGAPVLVKPTHAQLWCAITTTGFETVSKLL